MRAARRVALMIGLLTMALLPVTAAIPSYEPAHGSATMATVPLAIAQPIAAFPVSPLADTEVGRLLPESGLMILIGSGLMGLAAVVRRSTKI